MEFGFLTQGDVPEAMRRADPDADQILLLLRGTKAKQQNLEMIRLMGEHVIPKLDTDPVHRTDRMRASATSAAG